MQPEKLDVVILSAGRLTSADAARLGVEVKALARIAGRSLLEIAIDAMRAAKVIDRVIIVGPAEARAAARDADIWLDEHPTGEDNVLAGITAARTRRALLSASDLPFIRASHIDDFMTRFSAAVDVAYPIYERDEFLTAFPGGRTKFARVGSTEWTGGSVCVVSRDLALRHESMIRRGFQSRKRPAALAALFGWDLFARYCVGRISIADVERRLSTLCGGQAHAVRGADPALAMDCDDANDIAYAQGPQTRAERV